MVVGVALVYTMHLVVVVGTLSVGSDPLGTHTHTGTDIDNDFHSHLYKFVQVEHLGIHWALDIVEQVETQSDFRFDLHKFVQIQHPRAMLHNKAGLVVAVVLVVVNHKLVVPGSVFGIGIGNTVAIDPPRHCYLLQLPQYIAQICNLYIDN